MRIVVLDGYTTNPGDLDWAPLATLGHCTVHERTPPDRVLERAAGAEALLTNKVVLGRREFELLPELRYVGVLATGFNVVDVLAARERGVTVTNVPAYSTASVAQLTFALLLELAQAAGRHSASTRSGAWAASRDFCYWESPLVELAGLTFGVIGLGTIGRAVAAIARAFGMDVLAATRTPPADPGPVRLGSIDQVFRDADVVSLHCPLTPETERLVDARRLASMKPTAFLLNTARGGLVEEEALARALAEGTIAGAGVDVLSSEPPARDNPLLAAPRCVVTPHIGWASQAARRRLLSEAAANLAAFLGGTARNVVA